MEESPRPSQAPPEGPTFVEVAVGDPLKAVTRKERLYLLAISLIGIAMVRTGLVPTKISTFGIELDKPNRAALLLLLALVTVYFLVAFIIYAAADFIARSEALRAARRRGRLMHEYERGIGLDDVSYGSERMWALRQTSQYVVAALRIFFEFLLPIIIGLFAIFTLLSRSEML
jgi:hypothetical protein